MLREALAIRVAAALTMVCAGSALALTPVQKCVQAKLKAAGRLQVCKTKVRAKVEAESGSPTPDYKPCEDKFNEGLTKAEDRNPGSGCRFIDNHDGSVTDLNTGLGWEQKTSGSKDGVPNLNDPHDADNRYHWCDGTPLSTCTNPSNPPDGSAFTDFLAKLNGGTSSGGATTGCFANHCDWRLPTAEELQGILVTPCSAEPCIDPTFSADTNVDQDYASGSTDGTDAESSRDVSFKDVGGGGTSDKKSADVHVRAVRGGY